MCTQTGGFQNWVTYSTMSRTSRAGQNQERCLLASVMSVLQAWASPQMHPDVESVSAVAKERLVRVGTLHGPRAAVLAGRSPLQKRGAFHTASPSGGSQWQEHSRNK